MVTNGLHEPKIHQSLVLNVNNIIGTVRLVKNNMLSFLFDFIKIILLSEILKTLMEISVQLQILIK